MESRMTEWAPAIIRARKAQVDAENAARLANILADPAVAELKNEIPKQRPQSVILREQKVAQDQFEKQKRRIESLKRELSSRHAPEDSPQFAALVEYIKENYGVVKDYPSEVLEYYTTDGVRDF